MNKEKTLDKFIKNSLFLRFFRSLGSTIGKSLGFIDSTHDRRYSKGPTEEDRIKRIFETSLIYKLAVKVEKSFESIGPVKFTAIAILTAMLIVLIFQGF